MPTDHLSRRVRERHSGPYRAAIVAPIAELDIDLRADLLALIERAATEIARFDAELGPRRTLFNPGLLRAESASSSQIENLTAGARAIALAELDRPSGRNAVQVVANVHAMQAAIDLADRLDAQAVLAMHSALLRDVPFQTPGRWREQQVWIGGTDAGPHLAEYVPPHHDHVPALITDLLAFARRDDLPVLVQAALLHAQFETIHPFTDGNGRTGRALVHALLRNRELVRCVTVPISAGLLSDTDAYFRALTVYREGDPTVIIRRMAEAVFAGLQHGRLLVEDLSEIRQRWVDTVSARRDSVVWRLVDLLIRQPVVDADLVRQELGVSSANAHIALRRLADAEVITEITDRRRDRLWQAREVLTALDDFAARAGRRR